MLLKVIIHVILGGCTLLWNKKQILYTTQLNRNQNLMKDWDSKGGHKKDTGFNQHCLRQNYAIF